MKTLLLTLGLAILLGLGVVWLHATPQSQTTTATPKVEVKPAVASLAAITPTVGVPSTTPSTIAVNTLTAVTVTVAITPVPISNGVNLLRLSASGTQPTILGVMHDDGKNGDGAAGDGIYALRVPFTESTPGQLQLQVSAAFTGQLKRTFSPVIVLQVWTAIHSAALSLTFEYPPLPAPNNSIVTTSSPQTFDFQLSRPNGSFASSFTIVLFDNPSRLPLQQWFSTNVDDNSILMDGGTFSFQTLPTGLSAMIQTGSVPIEYTNDDGPVASAYVMSRDGLRIAVLMSSQENPLYFYGYNATQVSATLLTIASTLDF